MVIKLVKEPVVDGLLWELIPHILPQGSAILMTGIEVFTMKDLYQKQLLMLQVKHGYRTFKVVVDGTSMLPIFRSGDCLTICVKDNYDPGDILAFFYKNNTLLIHRLLKIENGRYFCKGDNSFRLEDIDKQAILGAVIQVADRNNSAEFIAASYAINRVFRRCGYDVQKTKSTSEYTTYFNNYLANK